MCKPDLTSVYAKLGRAEEHLEFVHREVEAWVKAGGHTFVAERNHDFTELALIAKMNGPAPDLMKWSLVLGDAIANLRDCLDHLIFAIAKHETRNNPAANVDHLAFLIVDSSQQFKGDARRRLMHLSAAVVDAIESFQPYNRPHALIPPMLAILRDLSNANKHRLLQLAAVGVREVNVEFRRPIVTTEPITTYYNMGEIKDGTPFCIAQTRTPAPDLYLHNGQIGMVIALWHGQRDGDITPGGDRSCYSTLLNLIVAEIKTIIETISALYLTSRF